MGDAAIYISALLLAEEVGKLSNGTGQRHSNGPKRRRIYCGEDEKGMSINGRLRKHDGDQNSGRGSAWPVGESGTVVCTLASTTSRGWGGGGGGKVERNEVD